MRRNKRTNRNFRGRQGRGRNPQHFPLTRVPVSKANNYPVPPELDTTLMYYVNFQWVNNGNTYKGDRWYTNAAYSPDIVSPSNKPNGFTALAGLYGSYKVIAYNYEIEIISREAFGGTLLVRHTNTDPGTSSGQMAYAGEALSRTYTVPGAGAPPVRVRGGHTIAQVTGRPIENDDILGADVTTVPSDQTFMGLFMQCLDNMTTAGFNVSLTIKLKTRFFNRKQVNDSMASNIYRLEQDRDGISRAIPLT